MGDKVRFAVKLAQSRWLVIMAAIWIQCGSGASYTFGIYSQTLKDALDYDQECLDTLASFKDLGANIGVVSGLLFDWFSPWGVLAVGALQSGVGYFMLWLSLTGRVATPALWQTCLYMFLGANGQTFLNTGCVVTCVQNFPRNRGLVVGLTKGFLGLSGAIMTQLYHGIYGNQPSSYLLMVAWLPSLTTLLLMFIIRPVPAREESHENSNLLILSTMAASLAAFLMGVTLVENITGISHAGNVAVCVVMCGILLLPAAVVVKSELNEPESTSLSSLMRPLLINNGIGPSSFPDTGGGRGLGNPVEAEPSTRSSANIEEFGIPNSGKLLEKVNLVDVQLEEKRPHRGEEHTIPEAVVKADFWLLVLAMACGMGSGLTAIDNTGQIGGSLGYTPEKVGTLISLFSIWNFLGRLGFGALSDLFLHRYKTGRPMLLACSQAAMSLGHLLISLAIPGSLYPASIVIGMCYGAQWSLMPAITSELFGLSRFATLFNTISVASPLGAYVLSVQVTGRLYDAEAAREHHQVNTLALFGWMGSEDLECHGAHCFRLTFIILAVVSLFGCMVCVLLNNRTRSFYTQLPQNGVARE